MSLLLKEHFFFQEELTLIENEGKKKTKKKTAELYLRKVFPFNFIVGDGEVRAERKGGILYRALDKRKCLVIIFLISDQNHML